MNTFIENQRAVLVSYITSPDVVLKDSDLTILPRELNARRLLNTTKCPASTTLKPKRDYFTGEIIDFVETSINHADANAKNSMSLKRAPGLSEESVRGSVMNFPFWPGGFDEPISEVESLFADNLNFDNEPKCTVPPGFANGFEFADDTKEEMKNQNIVNLLTVLEKDLDLAEWMQIDKDNDKNEVKNIPISELDLNIADDAVLENYESDQVLQISKCSISQNISSEWAEIIDTTLSISDFEEKVPEPAMTFPFELDNFQKQAIIKLEERKYVFIAAHTSAGKTVIAEYAIALSQNHMTRTIYTSPIKALSNQKYRDFKKTFKSVGLITGDLQIEPTASCLIMTTEILRSMLFCGSDITRDLEYVIFDEVHYINDPDRGHVWEEVIVLLPDHVSIIMLSATVPNAMELAEWVGVIKKRKVYVISTLKRPVPLEHYLYTDSGGKRKNNMNMIVDSTNRFLMTNYNQAKSDIEDKNSKKHRSQGQSNPKQEQTRWSNLIDTLEKDNKLPVIAFTLSRNRCDSNVLALKSKNLNTAKEKAAVHIFFQQCLVRLKPDDRNLKQVQLMKESLERGIGVHHSGILPIIKEIVEMAFQSGWVKVLFATETFAMGVNMPARAVVFDSYKKHDGVELRNLKPSEYTQMAGRAGRRGHDDTGTVIILCKQQLPTQFELQSIILGKADRLLSRFRLRYAVILNCLRMESITVEHIMQHSFMEFNLKKANPEVLKLLQETENQMAQIKEFDKSLEPLSKFFDVADEYLNIKQKIMKKVLLQANYFKELKPGKVIIVTKDRHYNKLGILLSIKNQTNKDKNLNLKILVLDHLKQNQNYDNEKSELWHRMISLNESMKYFQPDGVGGHCVIDITLMDIVEITKINVKIEADLIIKNWEQRQIERFRDSPPGQSVVKSINELQKLNNSYITQSDSIQIIDLAKGINLEINLEDDLCEMFKILKVKKENLREILPYTNIANFENEFDQIFKKKMLEKKIEELKFKNSVKNLSLYPDYCDKLSVLKTLKYIDENEEVTLKGNIAREMGQNELFITELILANIFNDLDSAEIAALLSGLVFQAKTNTEIKIPTEKIERCKQKFQEIFNNIERTERDYQLNTGLENRLNFGLIEVVYEWARNKPFSEITELTDIQEGIIVRCIQQLDETIQDVKTAAMRIGNPTLQSKMEEASTAIKRDIVFTASLYTAL